MQMGDLRRLRRTLWPVSPATVTRPHHPGGHSTCQLANQPPKGAGKFNKNPPRACGRVLTQPQALDSCRSMLLAGLVKTILTLLFKAKSARFFGLSAFIGVLGPISPKRFFLKAKLNRPDFSRFFKNNYRFYQPWLLVARSRLEVTVRKPRSIGDCGIGPKNWIRLD